MGSLVVRVVSHVESGATGGITAGRATLARLGERDVATIDSDVIVHQLFGAGTSTTRAIAREFGDAVLNSDGAVDRTSLGRQVFADAGARVRLEAIVHPLVYQTIRNWFETLDRRLGVASIPLLFETRRENDFDVIVVTACSQEQQVERIVGRGLSEDEARLRIAAQVPTDEKIKRADFVISTRGTAIETDRQVDKLRATQRRETEATLHPNSSLSFAGRFCPPRRYSTRGSADTARAARCCGNGSAGRCAGP